MDDVHSNGLGIFPFFGQHTLCTEGWPGEYRIKDGRPFVRLYFMYITIGGNPSFRRSRAADIPLHNSLFIDGGMCRGLMTKSHCLHVIRLVVLCVHIYTCW